MNTACLATTPRTRWRLLLTFLALALAGCATQAPQGGWSLQIAHLNDHHSHLDAQPDAELVLGGVPTRAALGGFARQTTLFKALAGTPRLLKLHAGDATTGTLYYTLFKGVADARLMNTVCFDAFAPGNHEFDDGDAALRHFLDALADPAHGGDACATPTLSANIVPQAGTPLAPPGRAPLLQPYAIRRIDGVDVGLVGITIVGKTVNSSRPLPSTQFLDEVTSAQRAIDALAAQGVRHIVLITHQGYANDLAMAAQLRGVDVIIGGDSHTLLGDFAAHGVASSGPYPTPARNRDGDAVCVGQAGEYAKVFARMQVDFDAQGRVQRCAGQAALVLGEPFQRRDASGAWRTLDAPEAAALRAQLAHEAAVAVVAPDARAEQLLQGYAQQISQQKARIIGQAPQALCLVRVPGENTHRSAGVAGCERAHTLARGSDAAQVVAQAFLRASRRAHFALQNAGGVRTALSAGPLSMNSAFTMLPFSNALVELDLTGAEMMAALEDAVANHLDAGLSDGSHPYAAGLRWQLDMSRPRGQRFSQVQVRDRATGAWQALEPARRYVLVTHDYVASGKDGYATLGKVWAEGRYINTYLLYTQTLVDHVQALGQLDRPAPADNAHQRVVRADGTVLP